TIICRRRAKQRISMRFPTGAGDRRWNGSPLHLPLSDPRLGGVKGERDGRADPVLHELLIRGHAHAKPALFRADTLWVQIKEGATGRFSKRCTERTLYGYTCQWAFICLDNQELTGGVSMLTGREKLRGLIDERCLDTGQEFVLSTGEKSRFYFDCKKITLEGDALALVAD